MADTLDAGLPTLQVISNLPSHTFATPIKKINEGEHVSHFLKSKAYGDLMLFLLQLNRSCFPTKSEESGRKVVRAWELGSPNVKYSSAIENLQSLLNHLTSIIDSTPPDQGPRRFGNIAFRQWHETVSSQGSDLLHRYLPTIPTPAHAELSSYLLGSFGSAQRLDYGSGHELSFLAFLAGLWKVGFFLSPSISWEESSRGIVLGIIQPYLSLIRRLITTYTLEPAGSHGVWGLDDHSFIPYIFGSAQLGTPILSSSHPPPPTPTEGSLDGAPPQSDVTDATKSLRWAQTNMYFSAISFIHSVKKGPFWEHSPMLYDISGVQAGWSKINKGMLKMYVAEVLGKFPVVQHFPFGSLFSWDVDPRASVSVEEMSRLGLPPDVGQTSGRSVHVAAQPLRSVGLEGSTKAPWQGADPIAPPPPGGTKAPWASTTPAPPSVGQGTKAPWAGRSQLPPRGLASVAGRRPEQRQTSTGVPQEQGASMMPPPSTKAPWAKDK